jgi:adenylosuccinate synthase
MVDVILGLQWGDEGKGKIVDYFASQYDIIARFQGGPNAGHTLYVGDKKIVLHQIPSGVFHEQTVNLIGNGVVLDPVTLRKEAAKVAEFGIDLKKNLFISERTHLILPHAPGPRQSGRTFKRRIENWLYPQRHWPGLHGQNRPQRFAGRRPASQKLHHAIH